MSPHLIWGNSDLFRAFIGLPPLAIFAGLDSGGLACNLGLYIANWNWCHSWSWIKEMYLFLQLLLYSFQNGLSQFSACPLLPSQGDTLLWVTMWMPSLCGIPFGFTPSWSTPTHLASSLAGVPSYRENFLFTSCPLPAFLTLTEWNKFCLPQIFITYLSLSGGFSPCVLCMFFFPTLRWWVYWRKGLCLGHQESPVVPGPVFFTLLVEMAIIWWVTEWMHNIKKE